jgi:hypothetical protein
VQQATAVGIQICSSPSDKSLPDDSWSRLLSTILGAVDRVHRLGDGPSAQRSRTIVSQITSNALNALVSSTSAQTFSFAKLFGQLVSSSKTTHSFSALRTVARSMNEAYRIEGETLEAAKKLYDRDVFDAFAELEVARQTGWTAQANRCEICQEPVWGAAQVQKPTGEEDQRNEAADRLFAQLVVPSRPKIKRKQSLKGKEVHWPDERPTDQRFGATHVGDALVVFRSGLVSHRTCLQSKDGEFVSADAI